MACVSSAWWPGGRTNAKPFLSSPVATLNANSITLPAACTRKKHSQRQIYMLEKMHESRPKKNTKIMSTLKQQSSATD